VHRCKFTVNPHSTVFIRLFTLFCVRTFRTIFTLIYFFLTTILVAAVIRASQATAIDSIDEKLMALQQELIQKVNSKEDYDEIADAIFRLRELRQKTTVDTAARDEQIKRINDLQDYISQQTTYLTEFDESLVQRWIKQITIWDDRITVELKSGVSIDVDA
jgi:site-specific DNA recombinase